jgi:hypothetical protein
MPCADIETRAVRSGGVAETLLHETAGRERYLMGIWRRLPRPSAVLASLNGRRLRLDETT